MSDPEKLNDNIEEQHDFQPSNTSKKSESSNITNFKDKIVGKFTSTYDENNKSLSESIRISNNNRAILMGLFALIGFIILVYAIFTASVTVELAQIATSVFMAAFIAAIVGAFTLFGVVVYQIRGEYRTKQ
jgi:carbon starvation protein CstA